MQRTQCPLLLITTPATLKILPKRLDGCGERFKTVPAKSTMMPKIATTIRLLLKVQLVEYKKRPQNIEAPVYYFLMLLLTSLMIFIFKTTNMAAIKTPTATYS
jgi:hypothetical protein